MTRGFWHVRLLLCTVVSPCLLSAQSSDSLQWGPQPGEITVSLAAHAMTWHTANLDLWLDPWLTLRHVAGTPANVGPEEGEASWDNLRGASFGAQLDGRWIFEGSLEELQGLPSAWDGLMMGDGSGLPGWGRAKTSGGGRVDVARARGRSSYRMPVRGLDTLTFSLAYAPVHWGLASSPALFSSEAASFPHAQLTAGNPSRWAISAALARWTGNERSPLGGSTESLFRQTDAAWGTIVWHPWPSVGLGALLGGHRDRPWAQEDATEDTFDWMGWQSMTAFYRPTDSKWHFSAEWVPNLASSFTVRHKAKSLSWMAGAMKLGHAAEWTSPLENAGSPLSAPLRPDWAASSSTWSLAGWRAECGVALDRGKWQLGARGLSYRQQAWAETWAAFALQTVWPLHVYVGAEAWRLEGHRTLPEQGVRWKVGLAHRLGMSPGGPTFAMP